MKLSDKILVGFFGLGLAYMLAAFAEIRVRGTYNHLDENAKVETLSLDKVGFLVVPYLDKKVFIRADGQPRIEIRSISGGLQRGVAYQMKGDTLILENLDIPDEERYELELFVAPGALRGVEANNASLEIKDLQVDSFRLDQSGGVVVMGKNQMIATMQLSVSAHGQFDLWEANMEELVLDLTNADVEVRGQVGRVSGNVLNESYLALQKVDDFAFHKDPSSKFSYRGY